MLTHGEVVRSFGKLCDLELTICIDNPYITATDQYRSSHWQVFIGDSLASTVHNSKSFFVEPQYRGVVHAEIYVQSVNRNHLDRLISVLDELTHYNVVPDLDSPIYSRI